MDDKKRNQRQTGNEESGSNAANDQSSEQNASNEQDQNPQDGGNWNNYRTREMSAGGEGQNDENFYHNRERGNYEPGSISGDEGGGSLY